MATATFASPAATAKKCSQVNVRMDQGLKRAGDRGLEAAGVTPSQAVRALWQLAARYEEEPEKLHAILSPSDSAVGSAPVDPTHERRRRAAEEGPRIFEDACRRMGISWPPKAPELSFEELKEQAYAERYPDLFPESA